MAKIIELGNLIQTPDSRPVKKMGTAGPEPKIEWLAIQYRAYLERRRTMEFAMMFNTPTFMDYVAIKTGKF